MLGLTFADLRLGKTKECPDGAIVWRADLDKEGQEWAHADHV